MAARSAKQQQHQPPPQPSSGSGNLYDTQEQLQSNTLKRHPKVDLNKTDLLRLLSYLEGELQARDVAIATLKSEKAKQLVYQAKYGRVGLGDPFMALQRDSDNMKDNSFDESAIKAMYDNQLAQLENLIATQRKAHLKMREQLTAVEKRYHKVCNELDEEKRKHAQDTAQGDDVTYMLEKERERLRQEIDYEKSQNKKLEKDLKKTLASLEEERAKSEKHKKVAVMLIKEQKKLIERLVVDRQKCNQYDQMLKDEKNKSVNMAEGLVQESKKTLQMEAAMEKQLIDFDIEREQLRSKLMKEESKSKELKTQVDALRQQVESLQVQLSCALSSHKDSLRGIEIKSSANVAKPTKTDSTSLLQGDKIQSRKLVTSDSPIDSQNYSPAGPGFELPSQRNRFETQSLARPADKTYTYAGESLGETRISPIGALTLDKPNTELYQGTRVGLSPGSAAVISQSGKVITVNVSSANQPQVSASASPRKGLSAGRGAPPPLPPNKPSLSSPTPGGKPALPPKTGGKDMSPVPDFVGASRASPKAVHIPVNVVHGGTSSANTGGRQAAAGESSPLRKPQPDLACLHSSPMEVDYVSSHKTALSPVSLGIPASSGCVANEISRLPQSPSNALEFLGPEIADLQQLLSSISADTDNTYSVTTHVTASLLSSSSSSSSSPGESQPVPYENNAVQSSSSTSQFPPSSSSLTSAASQSSVTFSASFNNDVAMASPTSSLSASSSSSSSEEVSSPIHLAAMEGDLDRLRQLLQREADVNLPLKDGSTPLFCAAQNGHAGCLVLLLQHGASPHVARDDRQTPLHVACSRGYTQCAQYLLEYGAFVQATDCQSWNSLHHAASRGHTSCCQLLLQHGAQLHATTLNGWTPLHCVAHGGHASCLHFLLTFTPNGHHGDPPGSPSTSLSTNQITAKNVLCMTDKEGQTPAFLAASRSDTGCLSTILSLCSVDVYHRDKWGRTILDVASPQCKACFPQEVGPSYHSVDVVLLINGKHFSQSASDENTNLLHPIGSLDVSQTTNWAWLQSHLNEMLFKHYSNLDKGLTVKNGTKIGLDSNMETEVPRLGIGVGASHKVQIGSIGTSLENLSQLSGCPWSYLAKGKNKEIKILLEDPMESLSYECLVSACNIRDYIRLLEQYKSVIFYGPVNTGKQFLAKSIADVIACREREKGKEPSIMMVTLHQDFTYEDMVALLRNTGCMLKAGSLDAISSPILLLNGLEQVDVTSLFGKLLHYLEYRGPEHAFSLSGKDVGGGSKFYLLQSFYIIATMDKARSTGIDLSIQQRFRWVHFRVLEEPLRSFLNRHFYKLLCDVSGGQDIHDIEILPTVEWIILIWRRLNDSILKLGLQDIMFGPHIFKDIPIADQKLDIILSWLCRQWNEEIAPQVRSAVIRGTGKGSSSYGQQKVANTALYVLMQRAVVPGCPLTGIERDNFLSKLAGRNELEISLTAKVDKVPRSGGYTSVYAERRSLDNRHGFHKFSHRRSLDGNTPSPYLSSLHSSSKRRSLSDTAREMTETRSPKLEENSGLLAKVPKLEIKSPLLTSLRTSNNSSGYLSDSGDRGVKHVRSQLSPFSSGTRRTRSSENLVGSGRMSNLHTPSMKTTPPSPFSFSLTTPTNLNSFQFLQNKSVSAAGTTQSSASPSLRRSLNALDQLSLDEQTLDFSKNLLQEIEKLPVQETEC